MATNSPYTHAAIYIGGDEIAESVAWPCLVGVRKTTAEKSIVKSQCAGVLRSQAGFGHDRPTKLADFVGSVLQRKKFYNLITAGDFETASKEYFTNHLEFI